MKAAFPSTTDWSWLLLAAAYFGLAAVLEGYVDKFKDWDDFMKKYDRFSK